jgi:energy-converting hydrogenase Eha subunit E
MVNYKNKFLRYRRYRQSQFALEFLMTYGWAILVILGSVSALAYVGVLDPGKYVPNICISSIGLSCIGKPIMNLDDNTVAFTMVNGGGSRIEFLNTITPGDRGEWIISPSSLGCTVKGICNKGDLVCTDTNYGPVDPGKEFTIRLECTPNSLNKQIKLAIRAPYVNQLSGIYEVSTIDITGRGR